MIWETAVGNIGKYALSFIYGQRNYYNYLVLSMNIVRELPPDYLVNCPTIDGKYKVLYKLGTGRFSKYA